MPCPVHPALEHPVQRWLVQGLSSNRLTHRQICLGKYPKKATVPNTAGAKFGKAGGVCQ